MTCYGVSSTPDSITEHHQAFGGTLGYTRFEFGPGRRYGWNAHPLNLLQPGDLPVISVQTWDERDFRNLLEHRPAHIPWFGFAISDEPEGQLLYGTLDANELRHNYARARHIRDRHENGYRCALLGILSGHAMSVRRFDWRRLRGALENCDLVAVNAYADMTQLRDNTYTSPDEMFGPTLAVAAELLTDWAISGFGCLLAADHDHARHADQLTDYIGFAADHNALWMSYTCSVITGTSYHLTDRESAPELATWKTAVRATAVTP